MNQEKPQAALAVREAHQIRAYDPTDNALAPEAMLRQLELIQNVMRVTMKDGEHFGKIPGCGDKPTLLKPGAEKLCLTFRLAPAYAVEEKQLERGHREYRVLCTLSSILSNALVGQGIGMCSTMESKYRYRGGASEVTDRPVPRGYWELRQDDPAKAQELIGGKGFSTKKVDGQWFIAKSTGEKSENPDIADVFNTVLKMAKKRALVDAVLTATAASDIFTQDLEDIGRRLDAEDPTPRPLAAKAVAPESSPRSNSRPPREPAYGAPGSAEHYHGPVDDDDAPQPECYDAAGNLCIHFGKNRGTPWSKLTDNQRDWYQNEWAKGAKKKSARLLSPSDQALLAALDEMVEGDRDLVTGKSLVPAARTSNERDLHDQDIDWDAAADAVDVESEVTA